MTRIALASTILVTGLLGACVTVNVYFPAAAAERAADRIIQDIYGTRGGEAPADAEAAQPDSSSSDVVPRNHLSGVDLIMEFIVPSAHAQQPDINISSPAIQTLKRGMEQRHQRLLPHYQTGALGMTRNGTLELRDPSQVDLRQRNVVKQLVAEENRDRNQLYAEIAGANGHPEWERDIRGIFASRWIGNAPRGWWYQDRGGWQQK